MVLNMKGVVKEGSRAMKGLSKNQREDENL
jgi:hypothetical protein